MTTVGQCVSSGDDVFFYQQTPNSFSHRHFSGVEYLLKKRPKPNDSSFSIDLNVIDGRKLELFRVRMEHLEF
jgi:hypothetical protein